MKSVHTYQSHITAQTASLHLPAALSRFLAQVMRKPGEHRIIGRALMMMHYFKRDYVLNLEEIGRQGACSPHMSVVILPSRHTCQKHSQMYRDLHDFDTVSNVQRSVRCLSHLGSLRHQAAEEVRRHILQAFDYAIIPYSRFTLTLECVTTLLTGVCTIDLHVSTKYSVQGGVCQRRSYRTKQK